MIESDYCVRFSLKPFQALRIAGKARGQEFERCVSARGNVRSEIYFTHAAGADPFRDFVVADRLTDQRVSLAVFDNTRGDGSDRRFDRTSRFSMCS